MSLQDLPTSTHKQPDSAQLQFLRTLRSYSPQQSQRQARKTIPAKSSKPSQQFPIRTYRANQSATRASAYEGNHIKVEHKQYHNDSLIQFMMDCVNQLTVNPEVALDNIDEFINDQESQLRKCVSLTLYCPEAKNPFGFHIMKQVNFWVIMWMYLHALHKEPNKYSLRLHKKTEQAMKQYLTKDQVNQAQELIQTARSFKRMGSIKQEDIIDYRRQIINEVQENSEMKIESLDSKKKRQVKFLFKEEMIPQSVKATELKQWETKTNQELDNLRNENSNNQVNYQIDKTISIIKSSSKNIEESVQSILGDSEYENQQSQFTQQSDNKVSIDKSSQIIDEGAKVDDFKTENSQNQLILQSDKKASALKSSSKIVNESRQSNIIDSKHDNQQNLFTQQFDKKVSFLNKSPLILNEGERSSISEVAQSNLEVTSPLNIANYKFEQQSPQFISTQPNEGLIIDELQKNLIKESSAQKHEYDCSTQINQTILNDLNESHELTGLQFQADEPDYYETQILEQESSNQGQQGNQIQTSQKKIQEKAADSQSKRDLILDASDLLILNPYFNARRIIQDESEQKDSQVVNSQQKNQSQIKNEHRQVDEATKQAGEKRVIHQRDSNASGKEFREVNELRRSGLPKKSEEENLGSGFTYFPKRASKSIRDIHGVESILTPCRMSFRIQKPDDLENVQDISNGVKYIYIDDERITDQYCPANTRSLEIRSMMKKGSIQSIPSRQSMKKRSSIVTPNKISVFDESFKVRDYFGMNMNIVRVVEPNYNGNGFYRLVEIDDETQLRLGVDGKFALTQIKQFGETDTEQDIRQDYTDYKTFIHSRGQYQAIVSFLME